MCNNVGMCICLDMWNLVNLLIYLTLHLSSTSIQESNPRKIPETTQNAGNECKNNYCIPMIIDSKQNINCSSYRFY